MRWICGETVPRAAGRIVRPRAVGASVGAVALGLALLSAGSAAAAAGSGRPGRPASALTASHAAIADDDTTASLNNLRTGWDPSEPA
jgi:hypothetical protein